MEGKCKCDPDMFMSCHGDGCVEKRAKKIFKFKKKNKRKIYKFDPCNEGECLAKPGMEGQCKCDPDKFMSCFGDGCLEKTRAKKIFKFKKKKKPKIYKFDSCDEGECLVKNGMEGQCKCDPDFFMSCHGDGCLENPKKQNGGIYGDYYDYNNMQLFTHIIMLFGGVLTFGICCVFCVGLNVILVYIGCVLGKKVVKNGAMEYKKKKNDLIV
eukprot:441316_1